jgi:VanZ family protein
MLPLAHARPWAIASVLLVALVVWGSLRPGVESPPIGHLDKVEHFSVYAFLAVWFTGLFAREQFWKVALALATLGLAMELLQTTMQLGRQGDVWDEVANVTGIATGLALAFHRTGGWAVRVEAWLARN